MSQKSSVSAIVEEREKRMIPPAGGISTVRTAHFLLPTFSSASLQFPKLPSVALSSKPNISPLKKQLALKCNHNPLKRWKTWVDSLLPKYQKVWEKAGIFYSIRASTYPIKKQPELVLCFAYKWCPETNTFAFPWGEATITLEDLMILGGFSVLGDSVLNPLRTKETINMEKALNSAYKQHRRGSERCPAYNFWLDHFMGREDELEHVALLVLWLTRHLFPGKSFSFVSKNVFSVAIRLSKGIKIALAPAVLASIYRDLTLLKDAIMEFNCNEDCSIPALGAQFQIIQLWAWERFPELSPETRSLYPGEPRLARWKYPEKKLEFQDVNLALDSAKESFTWRPYTISMKNWQFPEFYPCKETSVPMSFDADDDFLSFFRCLKVVQLVGLDCVEKYLPHRVAMQFGIDQDIPVSMAEGSIDTWEDAWNSDEMTRGNVELYLPPRLFEADVTKQYFDWWNSSSDHGFVVCKRRKRSVRKYRRLIDLLNVERQDAISTAPLDVVEGSGAYAERRRLVENNEKAGEAGQPSKKIYILRNFAVGSKYASDHVADQSAPVGVNSIALKGILISGPRSSSVVKTPRCEKEDDKEGAAINEMDMDEEYGREHTFEQPLPWKALEDKICKLEILASKLEKARVDGHQASGTVSQPTGSEPL